MSELWAGPSASEARPLVVAAGSAAAAIEQLHRLLSFKSLSPLTSDPDEWIDQSYASGVPMWQSKRDPSCFSTDGGQTWYSVDDEREGAPGE